MQQIYQMIKSCKLPNDQNERTELKKKIEEQINGLNQNVKDEEERNQKRTILQQRLRLIEKFKQLSDSRLNNLQRMFKHYCTHVFKTGKNYTFDLIEYENEHLTMQRFFTFILDFKLNQIIVNGEVKPLVDRNEIILLFKKCSSNARNLQLPEWITCVERLFILLFNQTRNYEVKQKKIKEAKIKKAELLKRREKLKELRIKARQNGINLIDNEENGEKQQNPQSKQQNQNDEIVKEMLKNFQIVNPTDQVKKAVKSLRKTNIAKQNSKEMSAEFSIYQITDEQKIQSYMQRIGIDNYKQIQKRLRYFEKANYRFYECVDLEQKHRRKEQPPSLLKKHQINKQLIKVHDQWGSLKKELEVSNAKRLIDVKDKLNDRVAVKEQMKISRCLSKDDYNRKKDKINERFEERQKNNMYPTALKRVTKRKQEQEMPQQYSLQMLHRSTPHQLPNNKIYPQRYLSSDPTDPIYMQQYGGYDNNRFMRGKAQSELTHANSHMIQSIKRRAYEIENQQAKRASQFAINLYQNHHYLQKFLERKW